MIAVCTSWSRSSQSYEQHTEQHLQPLAIGRANFVVRPVATFIHVPVLVTKEGPRRWRGSGTPEVWTRSQRCRVHSRGRVTGNRYGEAKSSGHCGWELCRCGYGRNSIAGHAVALSTSCRRSPLVCWAVAQHTRFAYIIFIKIKYKLNLYIIFH